MKTIADFQIEYRQFLDPSGKPVGELPGFAKDPEEMLRMYRLMTMTRAFDTKAVNLQRTGKLLQEIIRSGKIGQITKIEQVWNDNTHRWHGPDDPDVAAMREEDCFAPMYREYGTQFWRGVKMSDVLLYWGGDERGNDFAGPAHDFPWCVPIATQCLHAAGAARVWG